MGSETPGDLNRLQRTLSGPGPTAQQEAEDHGGNDPDGEETVQGGEFGGDGSLTFKGDGDWSVWMLTELLGCCAGGGPGGSGLCAGLFVLPCDRLMLVDMRVLPTISMNVNPCA